jgi:hypothetical protein
MSMFKAAVPVCGAGLRQAKAEEDYNETEVFVVVAKGSGTIMKEIEMHAKAASKLHWAKDPLPKEIARYQRAHLDW